MAYFTIPSLSLPPYRFDYHSHFGGILPVEKTQAKAAAAYELKAKYDDKVKGKTETINVVANIADGQELSLVGLFGGSDLKSASRRGHVSLFIKALQLMEEANPLKAILGSGPAKPYVRGECIAEDIYIACVCMAPRLGVLGWEGADATEPTLYAAVRDKLEQLQVIWSPQYENSEKQNKEPPQNPLGELLPWLAYFNRKIYSASKYTPFDDAYRARSFALKKLAAEQGANTVPNFMTMTLMYLQQEGIQYAQFALGEDEVRMCNAITAVYNSEKKTGYKLLAHTALIYADGAAMTNYLNKDLLPLFGDTTLTEVIGIDLLGSENKVGNYKDYFAFLATQAAAGASPLISSFGTGGGKRALRMTSHIHCGEGMGLAADNRSAIGYAMNYTRRAPGEAFYRAFCEYVQVCQAAAERRAADNARGTAGAKAAKRNRISGVFDEMFRNDSLTIDGLVLRRYDGNSERTRELVAYSGKRNMMAVSEALDTVDTANGNQKSYYDLLMGGTYPMAFRLGHAYYYRSFVAARYPVLAFDTNLGSNAITGASGLFASVESYGINRGLRHLEGYADTDLIDRLTDLVMYSGVRSLNTAETKTLMSLVKKSDNQEALYANAEAEMPQILAKAVAPIISGINADTCYQYFRAMIKAVIGNSESPAVWFDAMARVLTLFVNWRSYLLGADGQGVEHTDIQDEQLRCVLLLAYSLVPFDSNPENAATVGTQLQGLVADVATAYWQTTVGPTAAAAAAPATAVSIAGYKAPASVVTIFPVAKPA